MSVCWEPLTQKEKQAAKGGRAKRKVGSDAGEVISSFHFWPNHYEPALPGSGRLPIDQCRHRWSARGEGLKSLCPHFLSETVAEMFPQSFRCFQSWRCSQEVESDRRQLTLILQDWFLRVCLAAALFAVQSEGRCQRCGDSPSAHLVCSCHCLTRGRRNWSQVLLFPSHTFFMGVTVHFGWTGCCQRVEAEFTQLSSVCVCARAMLGLVYGQINEGQEDLENGARD